MITTLYFSAVSGIPDNAIYIESRSRYLPEPMSTLGQRPSSSSRDLTLVVERESGKPEEYFADAKLTLGRAKANTIHIDHPEVEYNHAKVVERDEAFWLHCYPPAKLKILDPEPGEKEKVKLFPGLTIELGGVKIRFKSSQLRTVRIKSSDYYCIAAGGECFLEETDSFKGNLPQQIGPYKIERFVAKGGMGVVLKGIHEDSALPAAVKLPEKELIEDPKWLKRFEQEVRTLKSVENDNLVHLQGSGKEGKLNWLAMEWVEGGTLKEKLEDYTTAGEQMPLPEIISAMQQVVEGLSALHAQKIVHRDLKPANLLVDQEGNVKVADFGLAKQLDEDTVTGSLTGIAGTFHYMAPEQLEGRDITPATDVYALGVIWHELLTGKRPGHRLKLRKQRQDCPEDWKNLIEKCLEDEPQDRPSLERIRQALKDEAYKQKEEAERKRLEKEAHQLYKEAEKLVGSVKKKTGKTALKNLRQANNKINLILIDFDQTSVAKKLKSGEGLISGISVLQIAERIKDEERKQKEEEERKRRKQKEEEERKRKEEKERKRKEKEERKRKEKEIKDLLAGADKLVVTSRHASKNAVAMLRQAHDNIEFILNNSEDPELVENIKSGERLIADKTHQQIADAMAQFKEEPVEQEADKLLEETKRLRRWHRKIDIPVQKGGDGHHLRTHEKEAGQKLKEAEELLAEYWNGTNEDDLKFLEQVEYRIGKIFSVFSHTVVVKKLKAGKRTIWGKTRDDIINRIRELRQKLEPQPEDQQESVSDRKDYIDADFHSVTAFSLGFYAIYLIYFRLGFFGGFVWPEEWLPPFAFWPVIGFVVSCALIIFLVFVLVLLSVLVGVGSYYGCGTLTGNYRAHAGLLLFCYTAAYAIWGFWGEGVLHSFGLSEPQESSMTVSIGEWASAKLDYNMGWVFTNLYLSLKQSAVLFMFVVFVAIPSGLVGIVSRSRWAGFFMLLGLVALYWMWVGGVIKFD